VVCFRVGKAPTRRNLGAASLISFVMVTVPADNLRSGQVAGPGTVTGTVTVTVLQPRARLSGRRGLAEAVHGRAAATT
jgi:hypothetical protein